jgi:hypothetical protein
MNEAMARPNFFVIPRNHVSAHLYVGHQHWLRAPGKGGRCTRTARCGTSTPPRSRPTRRTGDALLQPTTTRPYALADSFVAYAGELGLATGHPDAGVFAAAPIPASPAYTDA